MRPAPSDGRPSVLLVDDEPMILDSIRHVLEAEIPGLRVVACVSGRDALDEISKSRFDLIVTDFRMPQMSGLEFLQEASILAPGTPRILMTAYPDEELAVRAKGMFGVALMVAKPFEILAFVQLVRAFLDKPLRRVALQ